MSKVLKISLAVTSRLLLLVIVVILSAYTSETAHQLITETFGYQNPSGFFVPSWADSILAWTLTMLFLGAIFFGALGRRIDYIFIGIIILFTIWSFVGTDNVTNQMYLGLIGVAVVGNAIGYALKLARHKIWEA